MEGKIVAKTYTQEEMDAANAETTLFAGKFRLSKFDTWLTEYILSDPKVCGNIQERKIVLDRSRVFLVDIVLKSGLFNLGIESDDERIDYAFLLDNHVHECPNRSTCLQRLLETFTTCLDRKILGLHPKQKQKIVQTFTRMMVPVHCDLLEHVRHIIESL